MCTCNICQVSHGRPEDLIEMVDLIVMGTPIFKGEVLSNALTFFGNLRECVAHQNTEEVPEEIGQKRRQRQRK